MDEDDNDFGDFQVFNEENIPSTIKSAVQSPFDSTEIKIDRTYLDEQFRKLFSVNFDLKSNDETIIRSLEDTINDCPVWDHLTGNFKTPTLLNFKKSHSFQAYVESLKLGGESGSDSCHRQKSLSPKSIKNVNHFEEDDIVNDLDMHSLIISSFQQSPMNEENGGVEQSEINVDEIIEEIHSMYADQSPNQDDNEDYEDSQTIHDFDRVRDRKLMEEKKLLSLDASTLLDAALNSWQNNRLQIHFNESFNLDQQNNNRITEEPEESQFHSLPSNLNESNSIIDYNKLFTNNFDDLKITTAQQQSMLQRCFETERIQNDQSLIDSKRNKIEQLDLIEKLNQLSIVGLNELYMEMEQVIQIRSEILIQELALRDELEFEKEQKNTFISLLLSVQNKRQNIIPLSSSSSSNKKRSSEKLSSKTTENGIVLSGTSTTSSKPKVSIHQRNSSDSSDRKKSLTNCNQTKSNSLIMMARDLTNIGSNLKQTIFSPQKSNPIYLTTVIPYKKSMIPIDLPTIQILNQLLKALDENSPSVPKLLTDYILKVICPK
ncbi:fasciculation and elongation zeta-2-like protein [Sarcoptes scabiei]|nr:fasciculation and elongation zeta-2-like protein [Sarcoptes scabiei]